MQIRSIHRDTGSEGERSDDQPAESATGRVLSADLRPSSNTPADSISSNGRRADGEAAVDHSDEGHQVAVAPGRFASPDPLFPGCPGLFLQTGCSRRDLESAASLVAEEQMGVLFTINPKSSSRSASLRAVAAAYQNSETAHSGGLGNVLVDANRYSGKNRAVATSDGLNLDPEWIATQRDLGLPVALTDSPYIAAGDEDSLTAVLAEARAFGPGVMAVLPLHLDWLKRDVTGLAAAINAAGVPVALVLEHAADPLGVHAAVAGLARLLDETHVKVALLRSDLSVIGAIAFGAAFGAVGSTTGMRHLYPTKPDGGGFSREARIGLLVPRSMGYRSLDTLNTAIALDTDHPDRWNCQCRICYGRQLSYVVDEVGAYLHSLAAIAQLGEEVLSGATHLIRKRTWLGRCSHAQTVNLEIASETGLNWNPPQFQGAWHKLAATLPPASDDG